MPISCTTVFVLQHWPKPRLPLREPPEQRRAPPPPLCLLFDSDAAVRWAQWRKFRPLLPEDLVGLLSLRTQRPPPSPAFFCGTSAKDKRPALSKHGSPLLYIKAHKGPEGGEVGVSSDRLQLAALPPFPSPERTSRNMSSQCLNNKICWRGRSQITGPDIWDFS